jgi:superoxide reductase
MAKRNQVYKCNICGHIIEILHDGAGTLVCCGQPMEFKGEKSQDIGFEKHVPVIEKTKTGVIVKVGSIPHPMEAAHYIEWIEIIADGVAHRQYLKPGDKPSAEFCVNAKVIIAREYCSLHGLWAL